MQINIFGIQYVYKYLYTTFIFHVICRIINELRLFVNVKGAKPKLSIHI